MASFHNIPRRWFLLLILLLNACGTEQGQLHQQQFLLFGTLVDISIWGTDKQKAENAIAQITTDLEKMHHEWHAWHDSPLTRLNKVLAAGQPGTVAPSMIPLLQKSIALSNISDSLFNPAIGRLINVWGFQQDDAPSSTPPDAAKIHALTIQQPKMQDLTLAQDQLQSRNPNVQLDFGAIAKGMRWIWPLKNCARSAFTTRSSMPAVIYALSVNTVIVRGYWHTQSARVGSAGFYRSTRR